MTAITDDRGEIDKLTELLKEFTGKLRAICERKAESQIRYFQLMTTLVAIVGMLVIILALGFERLTITTSITIAHATAVLGAIAVLVPTMHLFLRSSFPYSYDVDMVAATVEKPIRLASQFSEHSKKRLSDKFELDLRIAEAEGALRYYKRLFRARADWTSEN